MDINRLLEDLIRIESHESVPEIQSYLLEEIEGSVRHDTGCISAEKEGDDAGPQIILNSHMDVVSPHLPFERDGDIIRGRGACDAKGCLVPMIAAFDAIEPSIGTVQLLISPDEETTQRGLATYLETGVEADAVVVGEPTGLDICPMARGHYDLELTFHGQAAHGATPESGINATVCMANAVDRIESLSQLKDDRLGSNSFTPTIARAGSRPNQVPDSATLVVDYRTLPVESQLDALETIEEALDGLSCEFDIDFYENGSSLDSFATDSSEDIVSDLENHVFSVTGERPAIRPFDAATEAAFFASDIPTVVFGPGLIADDETPIAHSEREFVRLSEVEAATAVLTQLLEQWLKGD
jgi:acetylornithine deacetylase